jgi:hypothetical protein
MFKKQKKKERSLFFVLGNIPKDYNNDQYIVSSLSAFYDSDIDPEIDDLESDPYDKHELLTQSLKSVKYYNYLSEKIGEKLNSKYDLKLSNRFWSIFLNSWLISLIQICLEREKRILRIIDKYKDQEISVVISNKKKWKFIDSLDFLNNGILNPYFNEWLNSRILEGQIPSKWNVTYKEINNSIKKNIIKHNKIKIVLKKIINFLAPRCSSIYGFTIFDRLFFSGLMALKTKISIVEPKELVKEDIDWSFDFIDNVVNKLDFDYFIKLNKIKIKNNNSGKLKLISADDLFYDSDKIIDSAQRVESGEYLIGTQHGGHTYGSAKITGFLNTVEINKCLQFFTWGWIKFDDKSTILKELPSPYLTKFKNKHTQRNDKIILVGTKMNLFFRRFESAPQSKQWFDYRETKTTLISKIHDIDYLYKVFHYRPYFNEKGSLKDISFLKKKFPDLSFIRGNLHKEIFNCRILILDHPGTTLNIALAGNIPLLCFWNEDYFHFNHQASKKLNNLKKNNIFFSDIDKLFLHLKKVNNDVSSWWNSNNVQTARIDWVNEFARNSNNWRKNWIQQIKKIN